MIIYPLDVVDKVCRCLIKLDLKNNKDKKYYNNCYDGWYNFYMGNKLELF